MDNLPEELVAYIITFLYYVDYGRLRQTSKKIPKICIPYQVYNRDTFYSEHGVEYIQSSYLLSNLFFSTDLAPSQIRHNFVEIKLCYGSVVYYFTIYNDTYKKTKNIIDYLENLDWKHTIKAVVTF